MEQREVRHVRLGIRICNPVRRRKSARNERATNVQRTCNEPATNRQRTGNEPATKSSAGEKELRDWTQAHSMERKRVGNWKPFQPLNLLARRPCSCEDVPGSTTSAEDVRMNAMEGLRAAMAAVDAFYKERGIFQGKFGFGERPALVVIDMAYGWTDPAYAGGSARLDSAITAIQQLLPAARPRAVPIIFTTSPYHEKMPLKTAADYSPSFRRWDSRACEIDERVQPRRGEYILHKEHASAFAGTPLVGHLIEHRVDTLL